ncbi:MAG: hypothetical protein OEZ37_11785, partial [Gemmatimonadota bacterium]|nr:hypothetical protein [Gemmatimonadota bacterium]
PVVGLAALAWKERGGRVLEDARIFWRVLGRPRSRAWMTRERGRLVEIFEELAEEMPEDYEPPGPSTTE